MRTCRQKQKHETQKEFREIPLSYLILCLQLFQPTWDYCNTGIAKGQHKHPTVILSSVLLWNKRIVYSRISVSLSAACYMQTLHPLSVLSLFCCTREDEIFYL